MTDQSSNPRRRWFQFSLRTLLIAVTLVAGLLVAWRVCRAVQIEQDDNPLGELKLSPSLFEDD